MVGGIFLPTCFLCGMVLGRVSCGLGFNGRFVVVMSFTVVRSGVQARCGMGLLVVSVWVASRGSLPYRGRGAGREIDAGGGSVGVGGADAARNRRACGFIVLGLHDWRE